MNSDGCPALEDQICSNVASITWPQTEIGETATVKCPCGVEDELINRLQATRVCGGTYTSGAEWKDPICEECKFSETRRKLCSLGLVSSVEVKACSDFIYVELVCLSIVTVCM